MGKSNAIKPQAPILAPAASSTASTTASQTNATGNTGLVQQAERPYTDLVAANGMQVPRITSKASLIFLREF